MKKIKARLAYLVCVLLLAGGCGGGSDAKPADDFSRTVTTTGRYKTLEFTATTRALYQRGETVSIEFVVKNNAVNPVTYNYGGCEEYYAVIKQGERVVGYSNGNDSPCTGNVKDGSFQSGAQRRFTLEWNPKKGSYGIPQEAPPPGEYSIRAELDVYGLGSEEFLDSTGINYPQPLGPDPLSITIR